MTWKDCKQIVASSARYRCDTCRHFREPMDSDSCKDCELNKYKPMLLKRFGEREGE